MNFAKLRPFPNRTEIIDTSSSLVQCINYDPGWMKERVLTMQPNICAIQKVKGDMAQPQPSGTGGEPRRPNDLPPEILEIIWPALQVGGLSGMYSILI
jgi:hypothetical protein